MDILKYELDDNIYIPKILQDDVCGKNICFLDIETTGLSSKYNQVILIGALCLEGDKVYITQFFAEHTREELELLTVFERFLNKFEYIITYNGTSFDLPFLKKRFTHYNIDHSIDLISHLDLLKLVRKNKEILNLENCKLKTVEKSLNIYREDTISGRESVSLYKDYESTKDVSKKKIILKHNYDDIFYLPKLLSIYDIIEQATTMKLNVSFKGFFSVLTMIKPEIAFKDNLLYVEGTSSLIDIPSQVHYKDHYSLHWDTYKGDFKIEIKYRTARLSTGEKCSYMDLSDSKLNLVGFNKANYNVPDNILLLKIDEYILYDNISKIIKSIIFNID